MRPEPRTVFLAVLRPLTLVLALVACGQSSAGQAPAAGASRTPAISPAARALLEGRYDDVDRLTSEAAASDPGAAALAARALEARGRYDEALQRLQPVAQGAPGSEAALELGLLMHLLGRDGADAVLERVAAPWRTTNDPIELARAARALQALNQFQPANSAFQDADAARPNDPAINTAWGELFLAGSKPSEALKSFQIALDADPKWTPALVGVARALGDEDPEQAVEAIRQALQINPKLVEAHLFLAARAVDGDHAKEAHEAIDQALAVNPNSLEAHTLLAAMAYIGDDRQTFDQEVARVLAIAPNYSEVYRVAGEQAARNYRYDEAVELTRKALALRPEDPHALSDLGLHLLRTGDEPGAREVLEKSFQLYPYDVVAYNLLGMMDNLNGFTTVTDGNIILRMNSEEVPVLQRPVLALAHDALSTLSDLYQFEPKGPILIEMFSKHDDFAVRNLGLPGMIGALGACFGRVVTLDSPRAQPPGTFQWEATLWHELAHVITIQLSSNRVPRWLTEGISVFEEKREKPEWARQGAVEFAQLLERGETIKLTDLNAAFLSGETISLAYYESSLLVDYIVKTYGDPGMRRLLLAYGRGLDTDEALEDALQTNLAKMQDGFSAAMDEQFGALRRAFSGVNAEQLRGMPPPILRATAAEHPGNFPVQMTLGDALRESGDLDGAMEAFERAAEALPVAIGESSPHAQMAAIALERSDKDRAMRELEALIAVDFDNVDAARQLATLYREAGVEDAARLRTVNERIVAVDPFDGGAHAVLGRLAMEREDPAVAAREFQAVLALKPIDQAAAHTDLAESFLKLGRRADARTQTLRALEIAPTYQRAQDLLLQLVDGRQ